MLTCVLYIYVFRHIRNMYSMYVSERPLQSHYGRGLPFTNGLYLYACMIRLKISSRAGIYSRSLIELRLNWRYENAIIISDNIQKRIGRLFFFLFFFFLKTQKISFISFCFTNERTNERMNVEMNE